MENSNPLFKRVQLILPSQNQRNWLKLPQPVILTILKKLEAFEVLESAQFVCKMWYILCKQPSIWQTIRISDPEQLISRIRHEKKNYNKRTEMMFSAVRRSDGGLIDLDIEGFCSPEFLSYVASWSSQLKRLRLACCLNISCDAVKEALEKLSSLQELELTICPFYGLDTKPIILSCPSLITTFKFNKKGSKDPQLASDSDALAIAGSMPKLRHLQLIGNNMTNVGLTAILDSCPFLQSLDLRVCCHLNLTGDLGRRLSGQVQDVKHPYDSRDDYKFVTVLDRSWYSFPGDYSGIYHCYDDYEFLDDDLDALLIESGGAPYSQVKRTRR
ncbi:F-box protein SKIP19-like [Silene latifolia]|uniref:F-box protein SKIP19-like n=1 Tax=Silene latifolia TaxID=37657 RepID=UPI003D788F05